MKEMLINVSAGQERRLAIVSGNKLEELYIERESEDSQVGNIYKGRVTNIEPSIQAAFIDFGGIRNGFLHISDLQAQYFPKDRQIEEPVGRKASRKDRPPIQDCLKRGQEIVCQVIKSGIGTKGPTLTTYLSVPGRFLVMMPGMTKFGVSRKIEDEQQREEMRALLEQINPPEELGFIVRTAGLGHSKRDLQQDLKYLERLWGSVTKRLKKGRAPLELYQESDLVIRTIRDVYSTEISRIICDRHETACRVADFLKVAMPRGKNKVEIYTGKHPLFDRYGLEDEIERIYSRRVEMPGGASLVIDQTEALVAIDVNSGKNRQNDDAEETAYKINQQAAREVARQLRLRDMGGVIIIDFIDMRMERHQRDIERILREEVKNDRAKTKILKISRFGLIEMTRQRMRPSLKRSLFSECPNCLGHGTIKSDESLGLSVIRSLQLACTDQRIASINLRVPHRVAEYLNNRRRRQIAKLENLSGKKITINSDNSLAGDEVNIECLDERNGVINWLPDSTNRNPMPSAPADAPVNMIGSTPSQSELVDINSYDPDLHDPWKNAPAETPTEEKTAASSNDESDQPKKKRRRRRRKKKSADAPATDAATAEMVNDQDKSQQAQSPDSDTAAQKLDISSEPRQTSEDKQDSEDAPPAKKRRRRGGRRHRPKKHHDGDRNQASRTHEDDKEAANKDTQDKTAAQGAEIPAKQKSTEHDDKTPSPVETEIKRENEKPQKQSSPKRSRRPRRKPNTEKPVHDKVDVPAKHDQAETEKSAPVKDAQPATPAAKETPLETKKSEPKTAKKKAKRKTTRKKTAKKAASKTDEKVAATESAPAAKTVKKAKSAKKATKKKTVKKKTAKKKTAKKKTAKKTTKKKAATSAALKE